MDFDEDDDLKDALCNRIAKTIELDVGDKYSGYNCTRRQNKLKVDSHRKGPIPIEECVLTKATQGSTFGTLDSDCDELDFEELRTQNSNSTYYNKIRLTINDHGDTIASCRALIMYFAKLANVKDEEENIDLHFVENLFHSGADVNFPDKHGQTILHEVARSWHPDVVKFALENGAEINKSDLWGRTPLHLAAAVDYGDMVQYLIENGAELGRETFDEKQTAMHYAAKNNACTSLKVMLRMGSRMNDRDYKRRTPLFVAAEAGRSESARFLIEQGAPCGVYDSSGTPLLSLLVEKMPQVAMEAVEQFHLLDRAFRKHYYYLAYLEMDPSYLPEKLPEGKSMRAEMKARAKAERQLLKEQGLPLKKKPKTYAKTPLEVVIQFNQLDLIMHPVFQRLLFVKWQLFGQKGSLKLVLLNLFYTLIWTILGILNPREGENFYKPLTKNWWRVIMELIGVSLTLYFLISEMMLLKGVESSHNRWRQWRTQDLEKDIKFCHPRWPEEEKYLRSELEQIKSYQRTYFREPWNIFEWVTYVVVVVLVLTRILAVASNDTFSKNIHPRVYAIGLIVIWLRLMRSCRAFRMLGPFIAILGSVIADTCKFTFLFFEFYIPYTVAFWILFGGKPNGLKMGDNAADWEHFHDLMYSVWGIYLMGDFNWDGIAEVDRLMAQILCGTYFALGGVICMNIYIAMLSDTFTRLYVQAQANAVMEQAKTVILLESKLDKFHRSLFGHYIQENCAPQIVNTQEDGDENSINDEDEKMEKVTRHITNRIDELDELWNKRDGAASQNVGFQMEPSSTSFFGDGFQQDRGPSDEDMEIFIRQQQTFNDRVKEEVREMYKITDEIKAILLARKGGNNTGGTGLGTGVGGGGGGGVGGSGGGNKNRRRSRGQRPLSQLSEPETVMTEGEEKKRDSRLMMMAVADSASLPNINEGL